MNQPKQPQNPNVPHVVPMQTAQGRVIEVCGRCHNPVPKPHSYQAPDNLIYVKKWCPSCGWVFGINGPHRSHQEANPVVFK